MAGQKTRQSTNRKSKRTLELEKKRADTLAHLDALSRQEQHLHAQLGRLSQAQQQMVGRLRLINEDLGIEEPLAAPPEPPPVPEAPPEGDGEPEPAES